MAGVFNKIILFSFFLVSNKFFIIEMHRSTFIIMFLQILESQCPNQDLSDSRSLEGEHTDSVTNTLTKSVITPYHINTMLQFLKVNSNTIELTNAHFLLFHLDLVRVSILMTHLWSHFNSFIFFWITCATNRDQNLKACSNANSKTLNYTFI